MSRYLLGLKKNQKYYPSLVGNKAFNLNSLVDMGHEVPPFFCITTQAYLDFLKETGLLTHVKKFYAGHLHTEEIQYFLSIAKELRYSILSQSFPPTIERDILDGLKEFKNKTRNDISLAIRSSAIQEDTSTISMAGQLKTFLNVSVNSEREIIEKIKECWASLWKEQVIKYLILRQEINKGIPSMGVIIQEMIESEISGVMFTVNPVTHVEEIIIEGVWGLGLPLVKGKVNPDSFTLDKKGPSIEINSSGKQQFMTHRDKEGSLREIPVPLEKRKEKVLSVSQLRTLSQMAIQIEEHFKSPQNIEWALKEDRFYFLQTRPLTIMMNISEQESIAIKGQREKKEPTKEKREDIEKIWTRHFFDERFPKPISPLSWSILKELLERRAFVDPLKYQGFYDAHRYKITELFYGRPYTNLKVFYKLFYYYPSFLISKDTERFFPSKEYLPYNDRRFPWLNIDFIFSSVKTLAKDHNWIIPIHFKKWDSFLEEYIKTLKEFKAIILSDLSHKDLFSNFTKTRVLVSEFLKIHRWSITYADILYHLSLHLIKKRGLEENLLRTTLFQLSDKKNMTIEIDREIKELAEIVLSSDILKHFFIEYEPQVLLKKLSEVGESQNFLKRFRNFLDRYGHRSNSLDIFYRTWEEDQGYVIGIIKKLIVTNRAEKKPYNEKIDISNKKELKNRLSFSFFDKIFPLRFILFKKLINWTQTFILLRENQRFYWQMSMAYMRKIVLEMERRLSLEDKGIDKPDDIFFLKIQEIYELLMGEAKKEDFSDVIMRRRSEWSQNKSIDAPSLIIIEEGKERELSVEGGEKDILKGMGVSSGKATGNARVLKDLKDYSELKEGDILVTLSIDPGWIHILSMVSGLVLEVGGLLSHASIIARELGIPSVVNIDKATQRISTGQKISINGKEGLVEFLK